jgi:hypothetical protein
MWNGSALGCSVVTDECARLAERSRSPISHCNATGHQVCERPALLDHGVEWFGRPARCTRLLHSLEPNAQLLRCHLARATREPGLHTGVRASVCKRVCASVCKCVQARVRKRVCASKRACVYTC